MASSLEVNIVKGLDMRHLFLLLSLDLSTLSLSALLIVAKYSWLCIQLDALIQHFIEQKTNSEALSEIGNVP